MRTLVIGDVHGRHDLLAALLDEEDVPVPSAARAEAGVRVVQVGDLANCVDTNIEDDLAALELARTRVDRVLLGNHEAPYFPGLPMFGGFHHDHRVGIALMRLVQDGVLVRHMLVGDTLVTHAGVAAGWNLKTASAAAAAIEAAAPIAALVAQVGRSRSSFAGALPYGGILWSDWTEKRAPFQQVHGHTPVHDDSNLQNGQAGRWSLNIDVGAAWGGGGRRRVDALRGVWLHDDGGIHRVVEL